ncbi:MAG: type II toxin-antitoxin system RelE/ParE family toxin [Elusimicrobiota bacterium]
MNTFRELRYFIAKNGKAPAEDWIENLRDRKGAAIIRVRLDRLAHSNPGDHKAIGENLWELRIHFGSGYRIYYGIDNKEKLVVLLYGGNKKTQVEDIKKAREYWNSYRSEK